MFGKDRFAGHYGRLFFSPDGDGGAGGGGNGGAGDGKPGGDGKSGDDANPGGKQGDDQIAFTPEQQKHIAKLVGDARKEGKSKAEQDAISKKEEDRIAAELKLEEEKGNFAAVKTALETDRDKHKTEAETTAQQLADAEEQLASVVVDKLKALEETGDKDLVAAFPKDAKPLEQLKWLNDPRTKAAIKAATENKKVLDANGRPRTPITPKPNGTGKPDDSDRARQRAQRAYTG